MSVEAYPELPMPLDAPVIETRPTLSISTRELERATRIRELSRTINANPEQFAQSCRLLGGLAVSHMTETTVLGLGAADEDSATRLQTFLANNDLRHTTFDDETDDAVYSHAGVTELTRTLMSKNASSQRVKQGQNYVARENVYAVELRDSLSALKLFLYAERVALWQKQQGGGSKTGDGAA